MLPTKKQKDTQKEQNFAALTFESAKQKFHIFHFHSEPKSPKFTKKQPHFANWKLLLPNHPTAKENKKTRNWVIWNKSQNKKKKQNDHNNEDLYFLFVWVIGFSVLVKLGFCE